MSHNVELIIESAHASKGEFFTNDVTPWGYRNTSPTLHKLPCVENLGGNKWQIRFSPVTNFHSGAYEETIERLAQPTNKAAPPTPTECADCKHTRECDPLKRYKQLASAEIDARRASGRT